MSTELSPKRRKLNKLKMINLQIALKDESLSDIIFKINNEKFTGIRSLFAATSEPFKKLLYSDQNLDKKQFEIWNITPDAFVWLKNHIYLSSSKLSVELMPYVLHAANIWEINLVKNYIDSEIQKIDTVDELIKFIVSFENAQLAIQYKSIIFNTILKCNELLKNYPNLLIDNRLLKISPILMKYLLKSVSTTTQRNYNFIKKCMFVQSNNNQQNIDSDDWIILMAQFVNLKDLAKLIQIDTDFTDKHKLDIITIAILNSNNN